MLLTASALCLCTACLVVVVQEASANGGTLCVVAGALSWYVLMHSVV